MPMGFSGAVSLISCGHWSSADVYGCTRSNSDLFSTPGFLVSPVEKREKGGERKRREGGKKGIEKKSKEGI